MKKNIIIGSSNQISPVAAVWIMSLSGLSFMALGLFSILMGPKEFDEITRYGYVIVGALNFGFGLAHSKISPWAPRVCLDESEIALKNSVLKRAYVQKWDTITRVVFGHRNFLLLLKDEVKYDFSYQSTASTSLNIKTAVRKIAESKGIEVVGG